MFFFFLKDVVTSCSELVPEFLQSDPSVLRGIKSVVCAEGGTSLEENLYKERLATCTFYLLMKSGPVYLRLWRSQRFTYIIVLIKHSILNKWKVSSKRTVVSYWYGSETLKFGMKKVHKFLVSTEIVVLWPWDSETWKFGVIKQVDERQITSVKELESCCFEC